MPGYAASDLIGNWTSTDKKLRYDFLEGFAPKKGVVIQYENGKPKSVDEWEIRPDGVKFGYSTNEYKILDNTMIFEGKNFQRLPIKKSGKIIELKRESQIFIDTLVGSYWLNPIEEESYQYKKGFSSTSGIYSITEKGKLASLGSWSFANGVIKIDSSVYPNGRIAGDFLFLLTSRNNIKVLKRGKKSLTLETVELKKKGKEFIRKLVSGRWMTPSSYSTPKYEEFRPIFGDLSGVIFNFNGSDFTGSSKWEYSLKTGSIKSGYTEYPNAQIQGPFLILLKKDGETETSVRPKGENIKEFTHAEVKRIKVTETDTETLRSLLGRQWYNSPDTYKFVFQENGKEGWLHKFRSYPFIISGNTLNIKGLSEVKDIRFVDGKIVLGDDQQSYFSDSKIVYLAHQGKEAATKLANLQKQKAQESAKSKLVLKIKMRDGASHRVVLPVGEMKNIISLSVEPGL
jgi:hypothetical protein